MLPDFRVRQRDYLLEISRALTQELDLDTLLARILDISIEMVAGHSGLIALRSESGDWGMRVSHGLPNAFIKVLEPYLAEIPTDWDDPEKIEMPELNRVLNRLLARLASTASYGLLTGIGLPLTARGKVVGVIFIFRNYMGLFSAIDRALLKSFADQAAIAVQNAQFYAQALQEKQRAELLINSAADGIIILTANHHIERYNQAFSNMFNVNGQDMHGKHHDDVIQWANITHGITLEKAEAGGWPLTPNAQLYIEGDLKRGNSLPALPVGVTYAPILSVNGHLNNIIATIRDITRFRQADELKSTFISIVSHELKTPVALIKGYVSTLRREDASWDRSIIEDSLEVIEEEADRLTLMIENLLDASRLQAGGLPVKKSDVLVQDIINRVVKRMQTQTSRHTIITDLPPDLPVILADETRLEQVLQNLVSNAIKYAPQGQIRISAQLRSDFIVICVSDEGPGIAPGDIPFIFDRFYRAPDMAKHTKGAGLGLYLTRAIIEAHGGRIWVDPEAGKGAQICFTLPLK